VKIVRRHPLSPKQRRKLAESLVDVLSETQVETLLAGNLEEASVDKTPVILSDGEPVIFLVSGEAFPTLRGFLRTGVERRFLVVDMGAVPHIANGADVMAPGVVEVDLWLRSGDLCVVVDERHRKPLCIARMLVDAEGLKQMERGKVAENIHHVGDRLWKAEK